MQKFDKSILNSKRGKDKNVLTNVLAKVEVKYWGKKTIEVVNNDKHCRNCPKYTRQASNQSNEGAKMARKQHQWWISPVRVIQKEKGGCE